MLPCVQGASTAGSKSQASVRLLSTSPHVSSCQAGPESPWLSPHPAEQQGTGTVLCSDATI